MPFTLEPREKLKIQSTDQGGPIIIMGEGLARLKNGDEEVRILKKTEVFGDLFQEGPVPKVTEVEAIERTVLFKIELVDFYYVMASHHDLAQGLIYNVTEKNKQLA
jgi:hypothetical protein